MRYSGHRTNRSLETTHRSSGSSAGAGRSLPFLECDRSRLTDRLPRAALPAAAPGRRQGPAARCLGVRAPGTAPLAAPRRPWGGAAGEPQTAPRTGQPGGPPASPCPSPASAGRARPQGWRGRALPQGAGSRARVGQQHPDNQAAAGPRHAPAAGGSKPERARREARLTPVRCGRRLVRRLAGPGAVTAPPSRAEPLTQTNKMAGAALPAAQSRRSNRQDVYC